MFKIPTVLFVSTTNSYRSRFAEAVFNHHAQAKGLGWCAFSRGLRPEGPDELSPLARQALEERDIDLVHTSTTQTALSNEDLEMAHLIIALNQNEHQPLALQQFPTWIDQFNFWEIDNTSDSTPDPALPKIEREIEALLADLIDAGQD